MNSCFNPCLLISVSHLLSGIIERESVPLGCFALQTLNSSMVQEYLIKLFTVSYAKQSVGLIHVQ